MEARQHGVRQGGGEADGFERLNRPVRFGFVLVLLTVAVITLWLFYPLVLRRINPPGSQTYGVFGDSFTPLGVLFSGLGLIGVIAALVYQAKQVRLQLIDLRRTQEQLAEDAVAQERRLRLLVATTRLTALNVLSLTEIARFEQLEKHIKDFRRSEFVASLEQREREIAAIEQEMSALRG